MRSWPAWTLLTGTLIMTTGCGSTEQRALAERARTKMGDCVAGGSEPLNRRGTSLVWDLKGNQLHPAHDRLDSSLRYRGGKGPITVFLVSAKQSQQMGTYSISGQPAYREWVNVCVVVFADPNDVGTVAGAHEVVSLDPRRRRPVQQRPEYGDPAPPLADWIISLPSAK
jgi:hypothetical protein